MKKPFTAPFWFLFILCLVVFTIETFSVTTLRQASRGRDIAAFSTWTYFIPSFLILLEAIAYWYIRKKNAARRASWTHVLLMTAAFFSPLLIGIIDEIGARFTTKASFPKFMNTVEVTFFALFWSLILIAHIIFIRVLRKARTPQSDDTPADKHLLDDVLS